MIEHEYVGGKHLLGRGESVVVGGVLVTRMPLVVGVSGSCPEPCESPLPLPPMLL